MSQFKEIYRKDGRTYQRAEEQTLIQRTLLATAHRLGSNNNNNKNDNNNNGWWNGVDSKGVEFLP